MCLEGPESEPLASDPWLSILSTWNIKLTSWMSLEVPHAVKAGTDEGERPLLERSRLLEQVAWAGALHGKRVSSSQKVHKTT